MFNLEQAIASWRQQMSTAGIKSPDVLEELEAHLREHIERQIQSGADAEHAYGAAVARIGEATVLRDEFAKLNMNNSWSKFLKTCYVVFVPCMLFINVWTLLDYELSLLERILGFAAVSLICLYLVCLPYFLKSLRTAAHVRLAKVSKIALSLSWLWPIWALLAAEHLVQSMGMLASIVLWCLYAAVAMTALLIGLNGNFRRPGSSGGPPPAHPESIPPARPSPPDFGISLPRSQMFSPIACSALNAAAEEASRLGHDYIGTEHVLLGVLKLAKGAFGHLLQKLHLDCETVRAEVERAVSAVPAHAGSATVPFTPRARKALQLAAKEAKKLNQPSIDAEHIFLGLLLEGGGVGGQVLRKLGIRIKIAREEILSELQADPNC
jgi:ClpA/ClpB-like protein